MAFVVNILFQPATGWYLSLKIAVSNDFSKMGHWAIMADAAL